VTLRDAGDYITSLPKAEQLLEELQAAVEALLLVVELNGPIMMARIGMMRALNRLVERVFDPSRKDKHRLRLLLDALLAKQLDNWRRKQDDLPGRPEAIRGLVEIGLKAKK
jgi:hypothetical protein